MFDNITEDTININLTDNFEDVEDLENEYDQEIPPFHPLYIPRTPRRVLHVLRIFLFVVGMLSDLLIIFITLRCHRMRNKTNLIISKVVFLDAISIIASSEMIRLLHEKINGTTMHPFTLCSLSAIDVAFHVGAFAFAIILTTNWVMKSRTISALKIVSVVYTLLFFVITLNIVGCCFMFFPLSYPIWLMVFTLSLIIVLFKEINSCYKTYWKNDPLSARTQFRLNIVRIYMYNWFVAIAAFSIFHGPYRPQHYTWEFVRLTRFISGFYLLIYLAFFDKYYKLCLLNLFKCKSAGDYDINATITFAEAHDNEVTCDDNVNIRFSRPEPLHVSTT